MGSLSVSYSHRQQLQFSFFLPYRYLPCYYFLVQDPGPECCVSSFCNTSEERPPPPVGGTEYSWCNSVLSGTRITVLGLLLSKSPDVSLLQTALHNIQNSHPILRSMLRLDASANTFHFITPPDPHIRITQFDLQYTSCIIGSESSDDPMPISPFHRILEYKLNQNSWRDHSGSMSVDTDLFHANLYRVSDRPWALFLRLHT